MQIEALDFHILKSDLVEPEWRPLRTMREYPQSHKVRFGHRLFDGEGIRLDARPAYSINEISLRPGVISISYSRRS